MLPRLAVALLAAVGLRGCLTYEYEHEIWLQVNGSGTVNVTGRPSLWTAFKSLPLDEHDPDAMKRAAREVFERSGLEVRRVTVTTRGGRPYLFVSADFKDVNRLSYTPAFPDLRLGLRREGGRLLLDGSWQRPIEALPGGERDREGLMAVRFHLPSKVYGVRPTGSDAGTSSAGARRRRRRSTEDGSSSGRRWTSGASSPRRSCSSRERWSWLSSCCLSRCGQWCARAARTWRVRPDAPPGHWGPASYNPESPRRRPSRARSR
jgi:hypothetical protein